MNETFQMRRGLIIQAVVCAVFFVTMAVTFAVMAFLSVEPGWRRVLFLVLFVGLWVGMAVLAMLVIVAGLRERLVLEDARIVKTGGLRTQAIDLSGIKRARWRTRPIGGSLALKNGRSQLTRLLRTLWSGTGP